MFLLVSVRYFGAHPGEHYHGVSIQFSISLGKTFLRISRIRNIPLTWILARVFVYVPSFISQILDFISVNGFDFYFDVFWMAWHWKPAIVLTPCLVQYLVVCSCSFSCIAVFFNFFFFLFVSGPAIIGRSCCGVPANVLSVCLFCFVLGEANEMK